MIVCRTCTNNPAVKTVSVLLLVCISATSAIVNNKIDRILDLSSQLVKTIDRIHIDESVSAYNIIIDKSHRSMLAYIDASIDGKSLKLEVKADETFVVDLTGLSAKPLVVTTIYTKLLEPYPAEIRQSERQLIRYSGSQYMISPYLTKTVTTRIKLPHGSRLESFTKAQKMTVGTNKLTYGPFKDVQPLQTESLVLHYENNNPFVAVTSLLRTVEVSPWTQTIHIVNQAKVAHVGAKLKGPFSRIDYQRDPSNGISSVKSLNAELPKLAKDIFYRDAIGNISTSSLKRAGSVTTVTIKPRFPLFGGWVTDFYLGYKVPMSNFLNEPASGNNHRLSIQFADNLYENMYIEDATLRITLPAGASNIEVKGQLNFERMIDDLDYSYLDFVGRPVVTLKAKNVVQQHLDGKPIVIRYDYSRAFMAQEPLILITVAIVTIFLGKLYNMICRFK